MQPDVELNWRRLAEVIAMRFIRSEAAGGVRLGLAEPDVQSAMRAQPGWAAFQAWQSSDDAREGPRAFAEKRAPNWTRR